MTPRLYLIAPRILFASDATWLDAIERVAAAVRIGFAAPVLAAHHVALQVRIEEEADAARLAVLARERAHRLCPELALYLNAACSAPGYDGVHWPERRIPDMRSPASNCAASVHSRAALLRAEAAGVAFAVYGPIWSPQWKDATPQGLDALSKLTAASRIPILAIGGITPERAGSCLRAGAAGVAVASGVFIADDTGTALESYASAVSLRAGTFRG